MRKYLGLSTIILSVVLLSFFIGQISKVATAQSVIPVNFTFKKDIAPRAILYPDVNYLQYLLNQDSRTRVATTGPGSMIQLTSYYGEKTKDAVMRFQELFKEQILIPAKLTAPNGYVGNLTRTQMNRILIDQRNGTSTYIFATSTWTTTPVTNNDNSSGGGSSGGGSAAGSIVGGVIGGVVSAALSKGASSLSSTKAAGNPMNFGGMVTRVTRCTCGPSSMLDIFDVRGQMISLIYFPGISQLFSYYNVNGTGQNVLGTYTAGGQCLVYHGEDCSPEGMPRGIIQLIGTSI